MRFLYHQQNGLTFFLITQSPNLIHRNVLALVDRHLHIRPTWAGRKIYEWAEYCRNPSAQNNKDAAITFSYKLPKDSFQLYHSATQHVKPVKRIPMAFYVFVIALILTIAFIFYSTSRVLNKNSDEEKNGLFTTANAETTTKKVKKEEKPNKEEKGTQPEVIKVAQTVTYSDTQLLTRSIDWSNVSACISGKDSCVCYGLSMERIIVPKESCELAVSNGWSRKKT